MPRYKVWLCGTGDSPLVIPNGTCSNALNHTPCPESYLDWHHWAEEMKKSYVQKKCPACKLYVILELKSDSGKRPRYSRYAHTNVVGEGEAE